jgi:hypothetical protein
MMRLSPEQYDTLVGSRQKAKARPLDRPQLNAKAERVLPAPKHTKYRSRAVGGYASTKEARRAAELKLLEQAGKIRNLREQVLFLLIPAQMVDGEWVERACKYFADFVYDEGPDWQQVVEDCKGFRTSDYKIKRKLLLYVHHIRIRET